MKQNTILESLESAKNYRSWMISLAENSISERVFELGSGLGSYAQEILKNDQNSKINHYIAAEIDPEALACLSERFMGTPKVEVVDLKNLITRSFEATSFISWNVLEHIEDDVASIRLANQVCLPGSEVFILVPASMLGYSDFDKKVGHFRRYSKRELVEKAKSGGLTDVKVKYVNFVGFFTWIFFVKCLRFIPKDGILLRTYDVILVPILRFFERFINVPIGQSLILKAKTT
jgi:SAM-dependent methyltransferase